MQTHELPTHHSLDRSATDAPLPTEEEIAQLRENVAARMIEANRANEEHREAQARMRKADQALHDASRTFREACDRVIEARAEELMKGESK